MRRTPPRWAILGLGVALLAGAWLLVRTSLVARNGASGSTPGLTVRGGHEQGGAPQRPKGGATEAAAPQAPQTEAEAVLSRLQAFLREGNTDDDKLISILVAYSQPLLRGNADAISRLRELLNAVPPDEAIVPYLVVLRALCSDADAFVDIERCIFRSKGIGAYYAVDSLRILGSPRLKGRADDTALLRQFWSGVLFDPGGGDELRPYHIELARNAAWHEAFDPREEVWASTLDTPTDARTRGVLVRAAMTGIPELARNEALEGLGVGQEREATARALLATGSTPCGLRATAVSMLTPGADTNALLFGLVDRETEPSVLGNMAIHIFAGAYHKDPQETARAIQTIELIAGRAIDDANLADGVASALSGLDSPESVTALSRIIQDSPSVLYRVKGISELCSVSDNCSTLDQRVQVLSAALWQSDPEVATSADAALLHLASEPQWGASVVRVVDQKTLDRMRHVIDMEKLPANRDLWQQELDALEHHK